MRDFSYERVSWGELAPEFISTWGMAGGKFMPEHLAIVGPTGSGKSFFMTEILRLRAQMRGSHEVIVATKPIDDTISRLKWPIIQKWPPKYDQNQVVFWPKAGGIADREALLKQRDAIMKMLNELWHGKANTVVSFDEVAYLTNDLGLQNPLVRYWREARALGITIVASTQRPRFVPRYMWNESTWTVAFAPHDEDDAKRVAQVLGNQRFFMNILMNELERKEFVITRQGSREVYISKVDKSFSTSSGDTAPGETRK